MNGTRRRLSRRLWIAKSQTYLGGGASAASSAVPVSLRVAEALTDGDSLVAETSECGQHIVGEVVGGLVVNIVANAQPLRSGGSSTVGSDVTLEVVLGVLDLVDVVLVVVVGVNIEVGNVVTKIGHIPLAARLSCAAGVGRAHVSGNLANNVAKSHLVLPHLLLAVEGRDSAQVQVGPGVGRDLVVLGVHALDDTDELRSGVNLTLVDVVTGNEEGSLSVVCLEDIKNVSSVFLLWAIVVGQGNCAGSNAVVDTSATVRNRADLGTGNRRGVGTGGGSILRAARTVLVVATRRVAVVVLGTAVCILSVSRIHALTMSYYTSRTRAALSCRA